MSRRAFDRRCIAVVLLVGLTLAVGACGGGDTGFTSVTGTTAVAGSVTFGEGRVPDGFPADFPIPAAATIGSTLSDASRGRYEVILFLPSDRDAAVVYFETNLANAGYDIVASGSQAADWRIAFDRDGIRGNVVIRLEDTGLATAAIDLTTG